MRRFGFWDMWNGDRQLLNDVIGQTEAEIENVDAHVRALAREVVQLRTVVTVLVGMLRDTNGIDPHVFDARLQAAYDEARGPASTANATCIACGKEVPAAKTVVTGDGPVCDACAAT